MISQKDLGNNLLKGTGHLIFWMGVGIFFTSFFSYRSQNFEYVFSFSMSLMPVTIITTYVVCYHLIPSYLLQKKYFHFGLYAVYTLIISAYGIFISIFLGLIYLSNLKVDQMAPLSKSLLSLFVAVYFVVFLVAAFYLLRHYYQSVSAHQKVKNKLLESRLQHSEIELKQLKMQLHPHFLFNSLNTLYGAALENSDKTADLILKLSALLDYSLYQVNRDQVPLSEEIDQIKAYTDLEKARFGEDIQVHLNLHAIPSSLMIPPMLLIPFVENAFKHGAKEGTSTPIKISLNVVYDQLHFSVKNSYHPEKNHSKEGIGLKNSSRRLNLLYPNRHQLIINNDDQIFHIQLKVDLNVSA